MMQVSGRGRENEDRGLEVSLYRMDSGQKGKLHRREGKERGRERRWRRKGLMQM